MLVPIEVTGQVRDREERVEENKSLAEGTDERRCWNQYVAPLFRPARRPAPFRPLFASSFFTQRQNLCYLLVTFIWSPRVLDLSRPSPLALAAFRSFLFLCLPFRVRLAIAYQQPAAPNSPELLIPDFRPVRETLSYSFSSLPTLYTYVGFTPLSFSSVSVSGSYRLLLFIIGSLISRATFGSMGNPRQHAPGRLCCPPSELALPM